MNHHYFLLIQTNLNNILIYGLKNSSFMVDFDSTILDLFKLN